MFHALSGLGSAVSVFPPSSWFLAGSVLAVSGALIGVVAMIRGQ